MGIGANPILCPLHEKLKSHTHLAYGKKKWELIKKITRENFTKSSDTNIIHKWRQISSKKDYLTVTF